MNLADFIKIAWLLLVVIGLGVTVFNLVSAIDDRQYARRHWPQHRRRLAVADAIVRNQIIITTIMGLFIIAGITAIVWDAPRTAIPQTLIYTGLIGGVTLLVVMSVLERRDRYKLWSKD